MYYISYATANDDPFFYYDRIHMFRMNTLDSGVDKVQIFISVSKVVEITTKQEDTLSKIIQEVNSNHKGSLSICNVEYKSNVGRDFSSHACNLRKIAKLATDGDKVLFLNRSAYGPLRRNWYISYLSQNARHDNAVICGSTINLSGHPDISSTRNQAHVQTYAFLSGFPFLSGFVESFPAETCRDRLDVIRHGEIGMSQVALSLGYKITSIAWPELALNRSSVANSDYPIHDIKSDENFVKNLPFRYKFEGYDKKILSIIPAFRQLLLQIKR